ncbi:M48 family metallopeptidase [Candidatus Gracilibacteria bacterium 28_42_T64]|nr:M48 family metallopeptidase [Candidatus Gracilibacteria bacterium 28_42_T64]
MAIIGLRTSIMHNRLRLFYLFMLIPSIVLGVLFLSIYIQHGVISDALIDDFVSISGFGLIILSVRMFVGVYFQKQMIFGFTGAKEITRKENPEIYNIVENLAISRGLPTPKVAIIEDSSLNAFATGWTIKNSWIVFSRGLLDKLNKQEIEAVAGHELTHIINGDVKNMIIINVFIGAIGTIGYYLMRVRGKGKNNPLPILGLLLYLISIIILPLINLAISRKKEFLADAGSVELTHDKNAMISALKKISSDSIIEKMDSKGSSIAGMFIENPKKKEKSFKWFRNLFSTHPSMEDRIAMLEKY